MRTDHEDAIFYTCSIIELMGRTTKNERSKVVESLGEKLIQKLYNLSDVYHCDVPEAVVDEFVENSGITTGNFDNVWDCDYSVPTYWDIGKVYQRLVATLSQEEPETPIAQIIIAVFSSKISKGIQNFNCAWYYSTPEEIYWTYKEDQEKCT